MKHIEYTDGAKFYLRDEDDPKWVDRQRMRDAADSFGRKMLDDAFRGGYIHDSWGGRYG